MERLIIDMMNWSGVSEAELEAKGIIETSFGEPLSYEYFIWARQHPIKWEIPTDILYGSKDSLQSRKTIEEFAAAIGAGLTIMEDGEHWFHTEKQMKFLDDWIFSKLLLTLT